MNSPPPFSMRAALIVLFLLQDPLPPNTAVQGQPATITWEHDGRNGVLGFRILENDRQLGNTVLISALQRPAQTGECAQKWTFGPNNEALRNGVHAGGAYGAQFLCAMVNNVPMVFLGAHDGSWTRWNNTKSVWIAFTGHPSTVYPSVDSIPPELGRITVTRTFATTGAKKLQVEAFSETDVRITAAIEITVLAATGPAPPTAPRIVLPSPEQFVPAGTLPDKE